MTRKGGEEQEYNTDNLLLWKRKKVNKKKCKRDKEEKNRQTN